MDMWLIQTGVILLVALVGFLLRQKDEEQAKAIAMLFKKHDEDAEKLQKLELRIAQEHYIKPELDSKFEKLELTIKGMADTLGTKFDKLTEILVAHIIKEDKKD